MPQNNKKDFDGWIKLKKHLHYSGGVHAIKNGDIWWCAVGENVGTEINGKSETFARPVLSRLYKKIGVVYDSDLTEIRNRLCGLILGKNVP